MWSMWMLLACAPEPSLLPSTALPPPSYAEGDWTGLTFGPMVPGAIWRVDWGPRTPGTQAVLLAAPDASRGAGPCSAAGVCADLAAAGRVVARGVAGADRIVHFDVPLPRGLPTRVVFLQAVDMADPGWARSTVASAAPASPPGADVDGDGWCAGQACLDPADQPGDCADWDLRVYPGGYGDDLPYSGAGVATWDYNCDGVSEPTYGPAYSCAVDAQGVCRWTNGVDFVGGCGGWAWDQSGCDVWRTPTGYSCSAANGGDTVRTCR